MVQVAAGEIFPAAVPPAQGRDAKLREPPEMRKHRRVPGGDFARCATSGLPPGHDKGRALDSRKVTLHYWTINLSAKIEIITFIFMSILKQTINFSSSLVIYHTIMNELINTGYLEDFARAIKATNLQLTIFLFDCYGLNPPTTFPYRHGT